MKPHLKIRPAATAASLLRRQSPENFRRLLEGHLSALIDSKDVPGWTINPAYHPHVMEFIQTYSSNVPFLKKALALQKNRASYYAKMASQEPGRKTVLTQGRNTVVDPPMAQAILEAIPFAIPVD